MQCGERVSTCSAKPPLPAGAPSARPVARFAIQTLNPALYSIKRQAVPGLRVQCKPVSGGEWGVCLRGAFCRRPPPGAASVQSTLYSDGHAPTTGERVQGRRLRRCNASR